MPLKGNILPQDSTFIFSENKGEEINSQFSDLSSNFLDDCKSMMINSDKYKMKVEEEKGYLNNNNSKINKKFQMSKELINSNNFSLLTVNSGNKYKNSNKINKNNLANNKSKNKNNNKIQKKSLNIKDNSTTSLSKNSTETTAKKFLNLYKETIENIYGQKIENDFEQNWIHK